MNGVRIAAVFAIAIICCAAITLQTWSAISKENNAFAKDCNDRGGMVVFGRHARQCIGARPTKETK